MTDSFLPLILGALAYIAYKQSDGDTIEKTWKYVTVVMLTIATVLATIKNLVS